MKNPITLYLKNNKAYPCGDPFILRFNGQYYLYPSTIDEESGIRCFVSSDLIHFEDAGFVVENPRLKNAYAPEVIMHNGEFYLCTSPGGNGHYILKGPSPLGPFKFLTDNIGAMIDGSFVHDENYNLKFIRADHNGIVMSNLSLKGKLSDRKDILPPISRGWTEGPTIFFRAPYYYATYCGNFVISTSYRVLAAASKYIDEQYQVQKIPLLLSTSPDFKALGHNSVVIGPNLDEYYIAYHILEEKDGEYFRNLGLNRLYFNDKLLACNANNFENIEPLFPDMKEDLSISRNEFILLEEKLLSRKTTGNRFTAEFNFKGDTTIYLSSISLHFYDHECELNQDKLEVSQEFDFSTFHSVRVVNGKKLIIYLDQVLIYQGDSLVGGKIGYKYKEDGLYFTAFTSHADGSSYQELPRIVPGILFPKAEENNVQMVIDNQDVQYLVQTSIKQKISFYAYGEYLKNGMITLSSSLDKTENELIEFDKEYRFNPIYLGTILCDKEDKVAISVKNTTLKYQYILAKTQPVLFEDFIRNKIKYHFYSHAKECSMDFIIQDFEEHLLFGLCIQVSEFSTHDSNHHPSFCGYLIGFRNELLVVEHCEYETTRIYDKPYPIKLGKKYHLSILYNEHHIRVYVDGILQITTSLNYQEVLGVNATFSNSDNVELFDYKEGKDE